MLFPRPIDRAYEAYETVIREELETPLQPATIRELKRYFERRRDAGDRSLRSATEARLDTGAHAFAGPRYTHLYRRWLKHGDAAFKAVASVVTAEALTAGTGRKECLILPTRIDTSHPWLTRSIRPSNELRRG